MQLHRSHPGRTALLALAVLILTAALTWPAPLGAATGTGSYAYFVDGQETAVPLDPLVRKDGLLLPARVLEAADIQVTSTGNGYSLSRGTLQVTGRLGVAEVAGPTGPVSLRLYAVRFGDQLFLPSDVLPLLGVEYAVDGNLVFLSPWPEAAPVPTPNYTGLRDGQTRSATLLIDRTTPVSATLTLLTPELIAAPEWTADPTLRGQALRLAAEYTLLEVKLANNSARSVNFDPGSFTLVDERRRQLDYSRRLLPLPSDLTGRLVPLAEKASILLFPRATPGAGWMQVFFEGMVTPVAVYTLTPAP